MKSYFLPLSLATLLGSSVFAVDENGNGLSDVWEQRFNASALELLDDDDGDGFSNLEECVGGTDPRDSKSRPELLPIVVEDTPGEMELSFQTLSGKNYTVSYTLDLGTFEAIPPGWPGDNKEREPGEHLHVGSVAVNVPSFGGWADEKGHVEYDGQQLL